MARWFVEKGQVVDNVANIVHSWGSGHRVFIEGDVVLLVVVKEWKSVEWPIYDSHPAVVPNQLQFGLSGQVREGSEWWHCHGLRDQVQKKICQTGECGQQKV